jgi:hypothetical protein
MQAPMLQSWWYYLKSSSSLSSDSSRTSLRSPPLFPPLFWRWEKYDAILKKENALDFDDILFRAYELLRDNAEARAHFQNAWQYVHVDEYQDTNRVQYEITEQFAIAASTDGDATIASGYDHNAVAGSRDWNFVASTTTTLASETVPTATETLSMFYLANISALTEAGSYASTITYNATANF